PPRRYSPWLRDSLTRNRIWRRSGAASRRFTVPSPHSPQSRLAGPSHRPAPPLHALARHLPSVIEILPRSPSNFPHRRGKTRFLPPRRKDTEIRERRENGRDLARAERLDSAAGISRMALADIDAADHIPASLCDALRGEVQAQHDGLAR